MKQMKNSIIINLFGGPGSGKSFAARKLTGLFQNKTALTISHITEYATDLIKEGKEYILDGTFNNQRLIYAEQHRRVIQNVGKSDVIITDSPDILSAIYCKEENQKATDWKKEIIEEFNSYNNFNVYITRDNNYTYSHKVRIHSEEEVLKIDTLILALLKKNNIPFYSFPRNSEEEIFRNVINLI